MAPKPESGCYCPASARRLGILYSRGRLSFRVFLTVVVCLQKLRSNAVSDQCVREESVAPDAPRSRRVAGFGIRSCIVVALGLHGDRPVAHRALQSATQTETADRDRTQWHKETVQDRIRMFCGVIWVSGLQCTNVNKLSRWTQHRDTGHEARAPYHRATGDSVNKQSPPKSKTLSTK